MTYTQRWHDFLAKNWRSKIEKLVLVKKGISSCQPYLYSISDTHSIEKELVSIRSCNRKIVDGYNHSTIRSWGTFGQVNGDGH